MTYSFSQLLDDEYDFTEDELDELFDFYYELDDSRENYHWGEMSYNRYKTNRWDSKNYEPEETM